MKNIISTFALLTLFTISFNSYAGYDAASCSKSLTGQGLTACSGTMLNCHASQDTAVIHRVCESKSLYTPVSVIECRNIKTNQVKAISPSQIFQECMKLKATDPAWTIKECYCCC